MILSFFGGVYNEFIILFCCGLERDTHNQVIQRADNEKEFSVLFEGDDDDEKRNESNFSDYLSQVTEDE